jgi:hypothetical protein
MQTLAELISAIKEIKSIAKVFDEGWGFIKIGGDSSAAFFPATDKIVKLLGTMAGLNWLTVTIDSTKVALEDLTTYAKNPASFSSWDFSINKEPYIKIDRDGGNWNFFVESKAVEKVLNAINPIDAESFISSEMPLTIWIDDLDQPIGGPLVRFLPVKEGHKDVKFNSGDILPPNEKIQEHVYFVTSFQVRIHLDKYLLTSKDFSSDLAKAVLKLSSKAFMAAIPHEFYNFDRVVIDGLRRMEIKLHCDESCEYNFHKLLVRVVSWLYEDRPRTRKKLFADRLTLELKSGESLASALKRDIKEAYEQAKDRYNFVVLDRKDAYAKELKDLLKDLRTQSDLYATKIRTLVSNLLRDVLAGIILVGFTLFTRFTDNSVLDALQLARYVFNGLAVYYLISVLFQVAVDIVDVRTTEKELKYWKHASKEYIPEEEFKRYNQESLKQRRVSFQVLYSAITLLYFLIGWACVNYPDFLNSVLKK